MDVSSTAPTNADMDDSAKVQAHTNVLFKGFRMILDQYITLQDADVNTVLPEDILEKLTKVLDADKSKRRQLGTAMDTSGGTRKRGEWNLARTAALIDRALANNVDGIKEKRGVIVEQNVTLNGFIEKAPHMEIGTSFMRSQAVEYKQELAITGPFKQDTINHPVYMGCNKEWFSLPKEVKLDFGKAEPTPGFEVSLGDPVKCGCSGESKMSYNKRPMFYKVLEHLSVEMDRIGSFFSILVQDARAEAKKGEQGLLARMDPILDDLDDICLLHCNRSAALLYLMCQNSREVALQSSGLTGFNKNWLRLAHASKILFEPGQTDLQNKMVKQGKGKFPPKRPNQGGDRGGYQGAPKFPRTGGYGGGGGGGHMSDNAYGGYGGSYGRF